MVILLTGGAGFIGSNFIFHMLNTYPDYRIICLDKLTYAGNLSTLAPVMDNPNFRFVKADICDRDAVYNFLKKKNLILWSISLRKAMLTVLLNIRVSFYRPTLLVPVF